MSAGESTVRAVVAAVEDGAAVPAEAGAALPLFGLLLLATALAAVPLALGALRFIGPRVDVRPRVPWELGHALLLALVAFSVMIVASFAAGFLAPTPGEEGFGPLIGLYVTVLVLGVPSCIAVALAFASRPEGPPALGLQAEGSLRAAGAGIVAYALVFPAWWGLGMLWTALVEYFDRAVPPQDVLTGILSLERVDLVQAIAIAVVVAPLLEEILFRGFLQPLLARRLGVPAGIGVTAFLFGILHGATYMPPLFALGVLLGVIQWRTGRLAAAWAVHALHNGFTLYAVMNLPAWQEPFSGG